MLKHMPLVAKGTRFHLFMLWYSDWQASEPSLGVANFVLACMAIFGK